MLQRTQEKFRRRLFHQIAGGKSIQSKVKQENEM